ncbi:hypothetical protein GA0115252_16961, partial [Streptomyces sp. DfronAA-171]
MRHGPDGRVERHVDHVQQGLRGERFACRVPLQARQQHGAQLGQPGERPGHGERFLLGGYAREGGHEPVGDVLQHRPRDLDAQYGGGLEQRDGAARAERGLGDGLAQARPETRGERGAAGGGERGRAG